jgi:hypothetical protein
MYTPDVSAGHLSDHTDEAYCRARFLEAFALAVASKPDGDSPDLCALRGFHYVMGDFSALLKAIHARAQIE